MVARRVLIIDDDRPTLEMMSLLLTRDGYEPFVSDNALEALDIARSAMPDLILLDVQMTPVDGWQFLDALIQDRVLDTIPVMLFTARFLLRTEYAHYADYIVRVLQKPVLPSELASALNAFFAEKT